MGSSSDGQGHLSYEPYLSWDIALSVNGSSSGSHIGVGLKIAGLGFKEGRGGGGGGGGVEFRAKA